MSFKLMEPFDAMARKEADLISSWEQLSPSATPRPSLQAASPGDLSANEEDDESLPLLSRKIAEKRQGGRCVCVCACVRACVCVCVREMMVFCPVHTFRHVVFIPCDTIDNIPYPMVILGLV